MRLSVFAKTFEGTSPGPVLAAVSAAGFSTAQYNMACSGLPSMPDAIPDGVASAVGTAAAAAHVEIAALSGTYNMIHPDPAERARGHRRLAVLAAAAAALPTRLITLCTGSATPVDQWRGHPDNLTRRPGATSSPRWRRPWRLPSATTSCWGSSPSSPMSSTRPKKPGLIDEIASPRLAIVLDPANLFETETLERQRDIVSAAIDLLADRIAMGHAKDRTPAVASPRRGKASLDYPHYLARLKAAGSTGRW